MTTDDRPTFDSTPDCAGCDPAGGFCHVFKRAMPESHFALCREKSNLRWLWAGKPGDAPPEPVVPTVSRAVVRIDEPPAYPCIYRGERTRDVQCSICPVAVPKLVTLSKCNHPLVPFDECSAERIRAKNVKDRAFCSGCDLRVELSAIVENESEEQTFRDEFYRFADSIGDPPRMIDERIVVTAGGWGRYLPSLFVSVSMLRRSGWRGRVEVWALRSLGEIDERARAIMHPLDVDWIDAESVAGETFWTMKRLRGWELKALAVAATTYRDVVFFDSDAYPVVPIENVVDDSQVQRVGAFFTRDAFSRAAKLKPAAYTAFGLPPDDRPAWESGQFYVDRARHWRALRLAWWLNSESERTYRHIYGDKDTFNFAWRKMQQSVAVSPRPDWRTNSFVHKSLNDKPFSVHRCQGKFKVANERFPSRQRDVICHDLPNESDAIRFFESYRKRLESIDSFAAIE